MDLAAIATIAAVKEAPAVELWKDKRAWSANRSPRDKHQAGREREMDNLAELDAVEDTTLEEGEDAPDMAWVEEWMGRRGNIKAMREGLRGGAPSRPVQPYARQSL